MTLRDKTKDHIENGNTLRNRLNSIDDDNQKVVVLYKNNIIGIGFASQLLKNVSDNFRGLLNNPIKEEIKGVSLYIKI